MKRLIIALLTLLIFLLATVITLRWLTVPKKLDLSPKVRLKIGQAEVWVDVAQTPAQRERGLLGRAELGDNEGMLFVFDKPDYYSFWMKGMKFPLDIIWIDKELRVVGVVEKALPESFPQTFVPNVPVSYVLEVNAGFAGENGIRPGDSVSLKLLT